MGDLSKDHEFLVKLQELACDREKEPPDHALEYWSRKDALMDCLRMGCCDPLGDVLESKWSMADANVEKLLQVSPVVRSVVEATDRTENDILSSPVVVEEREQQTETESTEDSGIESRRPYPRTEQPVRTSAGSRF